MNLHPFRRRLAIRFARLMRWLHIYLSMFGLAAVLFFGATGITLNHPDWFFGEAERGVRSEGKIDRGWLNLETPEAGTSPEDLDLSRQVNKLDVVEFLRQTHGIRAPSPNSRSTNPSARSRSRARDTPPTPSSNGTPVVTR